MPRGRGLVPVRAGTGRRVTRTWRTAPAGSCGYACPGRTGPHAGPRTSTTARARGNGGRIEHGSTPRLGPPTPGDTSAPGHGRLPDVVRLRPPDHPTPTPGLGPLPGHPPTSVAPGPGGRRTNGRRHTPGPPGLGPHGTGAPGRCATAPPGPGPRAAGPPGFGVRPTGPAGPRPSDSGLRAVGPRPCRTGSSGSGRRVTGLPGPRYRSIRPPDRRRCVVGPSGAGPCLAGSSGLGPRAAGPPGAGPRLAGSSCLGCCLAGSSGVGCCLVGSSGVGCCLARPVRTGRRVDDSPGGRRTPCPRVERPVAAPPGGGSRRRRDPGLPGAGRGRGCPGFEPCLG